MNLLDDGPAAYWRLGEASGTNANDETTNNKDGTYNGSPPLGAGDADTAVTLESTDDVNIGDEFDFAGTASFSVEVWINPTTLDTRFQRVVNKKDPDHGSGAQGWLVWVHDLNPGYQLMLSPYRWLSCRLQQASRFDARSRC